MRSLNGPDSIVSVVIRDGEKITWESSFIADSLGVRLVQVASECASRSHDDPPSGVSLLRQASSHEVSGTGFVGEVHCSFWTLCKLFGQPHDEAPGDPRVSWRFVYADTWAFTIYDWEKGDQPIEDVTVWNVGGKEKAILPVVRGLIAEFLN